MVFLVFFQLFFINEIIEIIEISIFFFFSQTHCFITNGTTTFKIPLALRIINYLNYLINKKELKKKLQTPLKSVNLP